jgi:hypothetical protein
MAEEHSLVPRRLDVVEKWRTAARSREHLPPTSSQPLSENVSPTEQTGSNASSSSFIHGDPNRDPFYLERSLENTRTRNISALSSREVELEELGNQHLTSCVKENGLRHQAHLPDNPVPRHIRGSPRGFEPSPLSDLPMNTRRAPGHCGQSSCSSLRSNETGATPDLSPSSSFSSAHSGMTPLEAVWKTTERLAFQGKDVPQDRSHSATRFYQPAFTSRGRPLSPTATSESTNGSSETLTMARRALLDSKSYLHTKPLPNIPLPNIPIPPTNPKSPTPQQRRPSPRWRGQINQSKASPGVNPVTPEPRASPLDHTFSIPTSTSLSPVPNSTATSPSITLQGADPSLTGRAPTPASTANEQSVWESDSDSESLAPKSQSRRRPIKTLQKLRSRVQLRYGAKSETRLNADSHNGASSQETIPAFPSSSMDYPCREPRTVSNGNSTPDRFPGREKQARHHYASSTASLPHFLSRNGSESSPYEIDTSTAAAIQARRRRRHNSDKSGVTLFPEVGRSDVYTRGVHLDPNASPKVLRPDRLGVFRRLWCSLQMLDCQSPIQQTDQPHFRRTM